MSGSCKARVHLKINCNVFHFVVVKNEMEENNAQNRAIGENCDEGLTIPVQKSKGQKPSSKNLKNGYAKSKITKICIPHALC